MYLNLKHQKRYLPDRVIAFLNVNSENTQTTPDCTEKSIRLEVLEKQIDEALQKFEIPKQFRDWAIKYLNELNKDEIKDREIIRGNAKEAYDDCVKKLDNLLSLKISLQNVDDSVIPDDEYAARRNALIIKRKNYRKN